MRQNHKQLLDEGRIKIYNGSIMDFDKKIEGSCFVVGLEILDNMPHDRLFTANRKNMSNEALTFASVIDLENTPIGRTDENPSERFVPIDTLNDPLINLFLEVWNTMPKMDHIIANKRIKSQGILKRLVDGLSSFTKTKS